MVNDKNVFLGKMVGEALWEGEIWTETGMEWGQSSPGKHNIKDKDPPGSSLASLRNGTEASIPDV